MKKKILSIISIIVLIIATLLQTYVFAATPTLEEIAETFNNSASVNNYEGLLNSTFSAITDAGEPDVLSISITNSEGSSTISYQKQGNILSYDHLVEENLITAFLLADSIGKTNGYNDGELLENFNMFSDRIYNYKVENEGFEVKEQGNYYSVKMDITKKVPLIDPSEFYLKPEDFEEIKNTIKDGEVGNENGRKSKLAYYIDINKDYNYIYIGEKKNLTQSAYKSVISALEVMYNKDVVDYFKDNYSELNDGTDVRDGFTVEYEADDNITQKPVFSDMKVVKVTIDNKYMKDSFYRTEYIGETVERGNKTLTLDFTKNKSYKLSLFDSVNSSDAGFLCKYILEDVFAKTGTEADVDNDTIYFNITNGKIVVGNKKNSIFKMVISDEYFEILPTNPDADKTTVTATHKNVKVKEYQECDYEDHSHFRYGKYNVNVKVIYGKEKNTTKTTDKSKKSNSQVTKNITTSNPKTGDNIVVYITLFVISTVGIVFICVKAIKNMDKNK